MIKKSIFFLTHFTAMAQNELAMCLTRRIYHPEEYIPITNGDDRQLIIINSGRVDILVVRKHNNQRLIKPMRTIRPEDGRPTMNVFGYSAVLLNRDIPLLAFTQEMSGVYILQKKDLERVLGKSNSDFESAHEIREKMLMQRNVGSI